MAHSCACMATPAAPVSENPEVNTTAPPTWPGRACSSACAASAAGTARITRSASPSSAARSRAAGKP
ncbi:hypothetical protein G6F40_018175 [Rhizopus arrhizus]|nr:hypothetical protein G6F40_018175 [Rhizopus arrhizus]